MTLINLLIDIFVELLRDQGVDRFQKRVPSRMSILDIYSLTMYNLFL